MRRPPDPAWLTLRDAAQYARVSVPTLRRAIRAGRLRHARVSGNRAVRLRPSWVDDYLEATSTPIEVVTPTFAAPSRQPRPM